MSIVPVERGPKIQVAQFHRGEIPPREPGKHLWIAVSVFRLADPAAKEVHLDVENLMSIEGPGCYWCEQPWTPELGSQPCKTC